MVEEPESSASGENVPASETSPAKPDKDTLLEDLNRLKQGQPLPGVQSSASEGAKARQMQYTKDTDAYRTQIESPEWQEAYANRRNFAVFGRNYINRIHCEGVIADVLYPTTKGVELEIKNGGHDLFLRIGSDVPPEFTHFPVDMNIICDGAVFQVNGVVDSQYPATNVELVLDGAVSASTLKRHGTSVQKAAALPHEERLAKILRRVWNDDPLPYWRTTAHNKHYGEKDRIVLRQTVKTSIADVTVWDFVVDDVTLPLSGVLAALRDKVDGEVVGLGRVRLRDAQRALVLTIPAKKTKGGVR